MFKYLLFFILSIFQDNFVRIGTIFGTVIGFWCSEFLQVDPISNSFIFGFIGWGFGLYIANFFKLMTTPKKSRFQYIKGGKE